MKKQSPQDRNLRRLFRINAVFTFTLSVFIFGAMFALPSTIRAAAITWSSPANCAADTDVLNSGIAQYAYDWHAAQTINGVTFALTSSATTASTNITFNFASLTATAYTNATSSSAFNSLSSAYRNVLVGGAYHDASGASATVILDNLTIGHTYAVQYWVSDPRGTTRQETITNSSGNTVTLNYSSTGSTAGGVGSYSIGNFTADATNQSFTVTTVGSGGDVQINAIQLRDLSGYITWNFATAVSGDSDVSTLGTAVYAYDWANANTTVNGVNFIGTSSTSGAGTNVGITGVTGGNYQSYGSSSSPFSALSASYQNILGGGDWSSTTTAMAVTLSNLTVGHVYIVQAWVDDSRSYGSGRTETVASLGGNTNTLAYNSTGAAGGVGQYTIGTFTANNTNQIFTLLGNASTQLNALQVRDVTSIGITWGSATTISGSTDVYAVGTSVYAYDWANSNVTVNGINFIGTSSTSSASTNVGISVSTGGIGNYGGYTSTASPFSGLPAIYQNILVGADWANSTNATVTVSLNNLISGHSYAVQVWVEDPRSGSTDTRTESVTSLGGNTVTLAYNVQVANGRVGQYTIGTFTANGTNQTFTLLGAASTQLNALQVLDETAVTNVSNLWGGYVNGNWNNSTANWGGGQSFATVTSLYTNVIFADTNGQGNPVTNANINIQAAGVSIGAVNFINNSVNYTFTNASGNVGITGGTAVNISGNGMMTFGSANTYTNTTTINGGTLILTNSGSILGSTMITIATNATLQLTQNGSLTNTAFLLVNAGGTVMLGGGVNQTVGAMCLGGQWVSDGTWGSSASGAANQNNAYFTGNGIITVSHVSVMAITPSPVFAYNIASPYYGATNPAPGVIFYMPGLGFNYLDQGSKYYKTFTYEFTNDWPVAVLSIDATCPISTNYLSGYWLSNSLPDTLTYLTTNTSPANMPLNYVLCDDEPYAGYAGSQTQCDADTTSTVNTVRASANTNVSSAFVGNYDDYPGASDPALGVSRSSRDTFYRNSGLNVAQPGAYPYSSDSSYGPNARSGLFWYPLELVSFVKLNLPAGHRLLPWLSNNGSGDPTGLPTRGDNVALLAHIRLRGADGYCDLGGLEDRSYGWSDLDWLCQGAGSSQILNLTTAEASGLQWSGSRVGANFAFMFSNLGTNAGTVSLPSFPGLPTSTPSIPTGTHMAWYFVNDLSGIATNQIFLGRDGINHSLFVNGSFTLTNAIQVATPGTNGSAAVTISISSSNNFSPVFAGILTLSNNVTLQDLQSQNLDFAGSIISTGAVTTVGNVTFNGTNSYSGGTTISSGTLQIGNINGLGSGNIAIPKASTNSGTLQLASSSGTLTNTFNGFNSTAFLGDSTIPDIENVSGTNAIVSSLTVTGGGGNGVSVQSDAGLLTLYGTISTTLTYRGLELNGAGNGLITGNVVDGSGGLAFNLYKDGTGVWTLSGTNAYTGPTALNNGTLLVNGSLASGGTVTVSSNGVLGGIGTIGGGIGLNGAVSPGSRGVGTLTTGGETWNGGASYLFSLNDATNSFGQDLLNINGTLNIQASSGSPFTINLISLTSSNTPGAIADFVSGNGYTWTVATASGGITNFNPSSFVVNTTAFSNAFTGSFSVSTNGNSLVLIYTVNTPHLVGSESPVLNSAVMQGTKRFTLNFSGSDQQSYHILTSTNLWLPLTNWQVLTSGTFSTKPVSFTDGAATNRQKFYRIISP